MKLTNNELRLLHNIAENEHHFPDDPDPYDPVHVNWLVDGPHELHVEELRGLLNSLEQKGILTTRHGWVLLTEEGYERWWYQPDPV